MYLRADRALAFETCDRVLQRESRLNNASIGNSVSLRGSGLLLQRAFDTLSVGQGKGAEPVLQDVKKILQHARKISEVGTLTFDRQFEKGPSNWLSIKDFFR